MGGRIPTMTIGQIQGPVAQALFPAFSRIKGDQLRLQQAYRRAQALLCTIVFPAGAGVAVLAEPSIALLLGDKWLPTVPLIQVLAILAALQAMYHSQPMAMAVGKTRDLFYRDTMLFVARAPLLLGGIIIGQATTIGVLMGAVIGRAIASLVSARLNMSLIRKSCGLSIWLQLSGCIKPSFNSLVMVGSMFIMWEPIRSLVGLEVLFLALMIFNGLISYLIITYILWFVTGRPHGPESELVSLWRALATKLRLRRVTFGRTF
ncbi:hypothetical protein A9995_15385 [Erythrobacter sp. QSSC1-22B]|nr:hypothetical protein A9995_15385 [Erythrobacter sp. QSSC1-22B]